VNGPGGAQYWAAPEPSAVAAALAELASSFTVAMGRPVATCRTWLDSVDLRLLRNLTALASVGVLLHGLIAEAR